MAKRRARLNDENDPLSSTDKVLAGFEQLSQSASQPDDLLTSQQVSKTASQPGDKLTSQQVSKTASQHTGRLLLDKQRLVEDSAVYIRQHQICGCG